MTFVSLPFFLFVGATVLVYHLLPLKFRWVALLVASYVFYWLNSQALTAVLLATTLVTFGAGLWMQRVVDANRAAAEAGGKALSREEKKAAKAKAKKKAKRIMILGIALDLGALLFLKYFNFFGANVNRVLNRLGAGFSVPVLDLLLPLGISFYTLQAIAYLADVYRGKVKADRNPAKFMLFMSFFPQIVQGPIARHGQLAQQLYEGHRFDYQRVCFGAQLMLWGLFKKLVIAERVAIPVTYLFAHPDQYTGVMSFLAAALYGLQVYADFSGGMDIARGVAQMVGVELELNFTQPYFSNSIENFWRRWHITMGNWMREYIFYPLSLSRAFTNLGRKSRKLLGAYVGKRLPAFLAMFLVYFAVGFWHGADWKYVVYGLWNGVFIMSGILLENVYAKARNLCRIEETAVTWRAFRVIRTFILVSYGRFFSAAPSLGIALNMFGRTFQNPQDLSALTNGTLLKTGLNTANWVILAVFAVVLFYVDSKHERGVCFRSVFARQPLVFRWAIYIGAVLILLIFGIYGPEYNAAAFIYQQF